MKKKDVHFENEPRMQEYQRECLFNKYVSDEYTKHVNSLVRKAKDIDDLIDSILADEYMKGTQAYAAISRRSRPSGHWKRVREMFGERQFKTVSDAGGVKVGNDGFNIIVPNGRGDGCSRVAVFDGEAEFNPEMMDYFTGIGGNEIRIYKYDCGSDIATMIAGEYNVYYHDGFVAFEKIRDCE